MKTVLIASFHLALVSLSCAQETGFQNHIRSYLRIPEELVYEFGANKSQFAEMSLTESVRFVYNNDTAKVYCLEKSVNMENERDFRIFRTLMLPKKAFRIEYESFFLIGQLRYNCWDLRKTNTEEIVIKLVDNTFKVRDSLVVYVESEFGRETYGVLNPKTRKIFLNAPSGRKTREAMIYAIDERNLKFTKTKSQDISGMTFKNSFSAIELLQWVHEFNY
jgi:hypothetical protein